jgi:hypothetical protein
MLLLVLMVVVYRPFTQREYQNLLRKPREMSAVANQEGCVHTTAASITLICIVRSSFAGSSCVFGVDS